MDFYSEYADLPFLNPPPGVVSNFDNPPSRALDMYVGMGICAAVSTLFFALRMYAKLMVTHSPGWDDLACSIGLALSIAHIAITFAIAGPHKALGVHGWDLRIGRYTKTVGQMTLATVDLDPAAALFIKLSLFLLYFQLFKPNRLTRWLIYGGIITCGLFYSALIIANTVIFMPPPGQANDNSAWLLRAAQFAHATLVLSVIQSVFSTLSDIYLLVIPIQIIFQLHFPLERKIGVSAVFMIGFLAIACSVAGLIYRVRELATADRTWLAGFVYIFCSAEKSAGIVCSCMPICASLLRGHTLRSRSSRRPLVLNQSHSLVNLPPHKRDSYLGAGSKDYAQLENDSGLGEMKNSVLTQRERLEY